MSILTLIGTAIIGLAVWYFRLRGPAAIGDAVAAAGHLRGAYSRRKRRRRSGASSTLAAIDDPGLAAAVYLACLASAGPGLGREEEAAIRTFLRDVVAHRDPAAALTLAKRAAREGIDLDEVGRKLLPLWRERLTPEERRQILAAAASLAAIRGPAAAQSAALRRLRDGMAN